jgi:hypothetical protein
VFPLSSHGDITRRRGNFCRSRTGSYACLTRLEPLPRPPLRSAVAEARDLLRSIPGAPSSSFHIGKHHIGKQRSAMWDTLQSGISSLAGSAAIAGLACRFAW